MKHITRKKVLFFVADILAFIVLVAFDQFTKMQAVLRLKDKASFSLIRNVLELQYLENKGAAFGMLQNQKAFFILIAILIMIIIVYVLVLVPDDKKYNVLHVLLVMVGSGACGNMIDRFRTNYVVDFIYFKLINFPIFNVADIYVTVSTFILLFLFLFYYKENDFAFLSFKQQKKFREFK
ncbi:MAG: signal peptidase II [Butyrivibrio sp.]|uniref:signal peptidase II n=1 Tax=Butyrivibrio sp. TaxID=28121 RepID=UPI0025DF9898|nr:signal peptidase II [Butyrivibrio sp.]MCR5772338.1 signal peptidase II [Butyrivibrio sp.]